MAPPRRRITKLDTPSREELTATIATIDKQKEDEKLANVSPQTLKYRARVKKADKRTRQTAPSGANIMEHIVEPITHMYSPSTQVRAIWDKARGNRDYWESIHHGNNGVIPDQFAEDHPYISAGANLLADGLAYGAKSIVGGVKPKVQAIYDNGTVWDKYTTIGGRLGYWGDSPMSRAIGTVQRRFNIGTPKPAMPELIRAENKGVFTPKSNGRFPWMNTTTTQPVIRHGQGNWNGSDVVIYDPAIIDNPSRYLSIEPMDTYMTGPINPGRGQMTVVSGNPQVLQEAQARGFETLSSPKLRSLYEQIQQKMAPYTDNTQKRSLLSRINAPRRERLEESLQYTNEIQRLISRRGLPTMQDYRHMSVQTGLPLPDFNPNSSKIALYGRQFAGPLRFATAPSTESDFKLRIGMRRNGGWDDHSTHILDDEGLSIAARNPNYNVNSFDQNPFSGPIKYKQGGKAEDQTKGRFTFRKTKMIKDAEEINGKRDMRKKLVKSDIVTNKRKRIQKGQQGMRFASYTPVETPIYKPEEMSPFSEYNYPSTQQQYVVEEPTFELFTEEQPIAQEVLKPKTVKQAPYKGKNQWSRDLADAYRRAGITNENAIRMLIAQDAQESGWGKSVYGNFNYGNLTTGSSWKGKSVRGKDSDGKGRTIYNNFRSYNSIDEYAKDKVDFLTRLYDFNQDDDIHTFARKLQGGNRKKRNYAGDPNYVKSITKIYNGL